MSYGINTRCIYGEEREQGDEKHYGALSYPIYQTATFQHPQVGVSSGYDYSRLSNPTRNQLESVVDRKSTRLNSSHKHRYRMPSSA